MEPYKTDQEKEFTSKLGFHLRGINALIMAQTLGEPFKSVARHVQKIADYQAKQNRLIDEYAKTMTIEVAKLTLRNEGILNHFNSHLLLDVADFSARVEAAKRILSAIEPEPEIKPKKYQNRTERPKFYKNKGRFETQD